MQALRVPVVGFGVRRLTNRCSGPPTIKCSAAGVDLPPTSLLPRARVLTRQPAAAELSRYTTGSFRVVFTLSSTNKNLV